MTVFKYGNICLEDFSLSLPESLILFIMNRIERVNLDLHLRVKWLCLDL